ncbi:MAG: DUF4340 domain-containing protein [Nitrospirota bacterium]|nr:DUF4340 domain-containing protein [Nitrospirota bacterium]
MRFRTLLILCVVLAILAGLLVVTRVSEQSGSVQREVLVPLTADQITAIAMESPDGALTLTRVDEKWRVTAPADYPADLSRVTYILTSLAGLASRGVISTNPDKAARFAVDEQSATRVSLFAGGDTPAVRLFLGKNTESMLNSYARLDGSDTVHEVQGTMRSAMQTDPAHWRDRAVLMFDPDSIGRIELTGAVNLALERDPDTLWNWVGTAPRETAPDTEKVSRVLNAINSMRASSFVDETPEPAAPLLTVALTPSGAEQPLMLTVEALAEGGNYRVFSGAGGQRVVVPGAVLSQLLADPAGTFAADAEPPAP